jgi:hypothetical protein
MREEGARFSLETQMGFEGGERRRGAVVKRGHAALVTTQEDDKQRYVCCAANEDVKMGHQNVAPGRKN